MTKTTKTTRTTEELYTEAEKAVYIVLRARHEKSGLNFLAELQNAQSTDKECRRASEIADKITPLENTLAELQEELNTLEELKTEADKQANNIRNAQELRRTSAEFSRTLTAQITLKKDHIKRLRGEIADLYKLLNNSFSDRADLTQVAVMNILHYEQNPVALTPSILAVYGVENADELTDTERADAQSRANYKAVINAVGRAVSGVAVPEALNRHTTKAEKITTEQYIEYLNTYGRLDENHNKTLEAVKIAVSRKRCRASDCYITIEYRDTKKQKGYYKVTHYKTVAPYSYIEDLTPTDENGENDIAYLKTYNPIIDSYGDLEKLEQLFDDCNFTDLERLIIEYYERGCRYTDHKEDIIKYIASSLKISKSTIYRHLNNIKSELEPRAKAKKLLK